MDSAEVLEDTAEDGNRTASRYSIRAVDRVLDILDLLQRAHGGVSLGKLSQVISLPKSSVFRYLVTLEARDYVVRDADDTYRLGHASSPMRPREVSLLVAIARPRMEELCRRFEETINLGVLDGTRVAYLEMVESPRAMRFAARPGHSDPVHSTGLGKVLAAGLSDDGIRRVLAVEGMRALTERTITTPGRFLEEVSRVRSRGYAIDNLENEQGGRCVAVPIPGPLAAAISLSAPAARFGEEAVAEVAGVLRSAAESIAVEVARAGH